MNRILPLCWTWALLTGMALGAAVDFDTDFDETATLRLDYLHVGCAREEWVVLDELRREGPWPGSRRHLVDETNLGAYQVRVHDAATWRVLFSTGFDGIFPEYRTTDPALAGERRACAASVRLPWPRRPVVVVFLTRERRQLLLRELAVFRVDPAGVDIRRETAPRPGVEVMTTHQTGPPAERCDILFLAEGYTAGERDKFRADLERFTGYLLGCEPFASLRDRLNVAGVFAPSPESGVDEPRQGVFRRTALNASFNALGIDRYLLTEDHKAVRDLAAHAPYDTLVVLVNSRRYGGGGLYGHYAVCTADEPDWPDQVFLHELGHSFAGLADEYYTADVAYNDFYPRGIEPLEPNITACLAPGGRPKWADRLDPELAVPTPWAKEAYETAAAEYNRARNAFSEEMAGLRREGASESAVREREAAWRIESAELHARRSAPLTDPALAGRVGGFEGAGYSATGLFRPTLNCMMFQYARDGGFCPVCRDAITRRILLFAE